MSDFDIKLESTAQRHAIAAKCINAARDVWFDAFAAMNDTAQESVLRALEAGGKVLVHVELGLEPRIDAELVVGPARVSLLETRSEPKTRH